jgi:predicted dienelactone hydrolase
MKTAGILAALGCLMFVSTGAQSAPPYNAGMTYRTIPVDKPYDWRGAKTHALSAVVWYPVPATASAAAQWIGPPNQPLFAAGRAAPNGTIIAKPTQLPLILLSHGTGGAALQMAWLATVLAAHGYIAVAVNHPGNNGFEGYTARGFATWWERARDLSTVADAMLADAQFGHRIDPKRIGAAGFSLGGYTMIELAGGRTDPQAFIAFCKSPQADDLCKSPPEFPTLSEDLVRLTDTDPEFQAALRHAGDSYRDPRVRAVFAIAPALGPAFPASGLEKIAIPVHILAGTADKNVPIDSSARYFATHIRGAKLTLVPGVGHYTFLDSCTAAGRTAMPNLCSDGPGIDRDAAHAEAAEQVVEFFQQTLK